MVPADGNNGLNVLASSLGISSLSFSLMSHTIIPVRFKNHSTYYHATCNSYIIKAVSATIDIIRATWIGNAVPVQSRENCVAI